MSNTSTKIKLDFEYEPTALYPLVINHNEFALVTGQMLNEINKELNRIINFNTDPCTIKIRPEEWKWNISIPELERKMISKITN